VASLAVTPVPKTQGIEDFKFKRVETCIMFPFSSLTVIYHLSLSCKRDKIKLKKSVFAISGMKKFLTNPSSVSAT
jgi:hypothetical protein